MHHFIQKQIKTVPSLSLISFMPFRWEVCVEFINQHSNNQRTAKEVLAKAKEMQSGNFAMSSLKEEVNKLAYENLQKGTYFGKGSFNFPQ